MFKNWILAGVLIIGLATLALSAVPQTINFQGYLKNSDGTPVNTTVTITFSLYSSNPARNNPVWRDTQSVTPANGVYSVVLGQATPIVAPFDVLYWLGVKVDPDPELTPLQPLAASPYAFRAATADNVGAAAIADSSVSSAKISGPLTVAVGGTGAATVAGARSSLSVPGLATANIFTTGDQTIQTGTAATKGLVVKGAAAQSANLQEWQNSGATAVASVSPTGVFTGNGSGLTSLNAAQIPSLSATYVDLASTQIVAGAKTFNSPVTVNSTLSATASSGNVISGSTNGSGIAVYGVTSGVGYGVEGYTSGSGSGGYFWSNGSGKSIVGYMPGSGYAGFFQIINPANGSSTVFASTNGTGDALYTVTTGSGNAGNFQGKVNVSGNLTVGGTVTGNGSGLTNLTAAQIPSLSATYVDLATTQTVAGAKTFSSPVTVNSTLSATAGSGNVITGSTNGSGIAVYGSTSGAGYGVEGYSSGSGSGGYFWTSGAGNGIVGFTSGSGKAGHFEINNGSNTADALYAKTNGTGNAGNFQGKLNVSGNLTVGGTITGNGSGLTNVQKKYGKTAVAAQSGGDYTSPVTAMTNIAAWCGTPSATNTCLLKIMPGVYDLGAGMLTMQQYVDIEGSGENATVITSAFSSSIYGTVNGASNAEIRFLTVKNTGTGTYVNAIANNSASPRISNVTATASGGTYNYGVSNFTSSPTMTAVTATATGGSSDIGVFNNNSSSPTMANVIATASGGGTTNYGVYNGSSSPTMTTVTATASSGGTGSNYGISNTSSSSPTLTNVIATASGGGYSFGIYNDASSPTLTDVTATAKNGTTFNIGMINDAGSGSYTIQIDRSTFEGASNSIRNDTEFTLNIGASKLMGPANSLGTYSYRASSIDNSVVTTGASMGIGTTTPTEALDVVGNIRINDKDVYLRGDANHGLGWYGSGKNFASTSPDGPVLYGYSGGVLGTTSGGQKVMMSWTTSGFDFYGYSRFRLLSSGSTSACLDANNTISACSSDARLKKDVVTLSDTMDVLEALPKLRGVTFTWDRSNDRVAGMGDGQDLGMIAQEVEKVFPEIVHTDKDGYKSLDYPKLVAFLVEVNKAQQKKIQNLNERIETIEQRLSAIGK